MGIKNPPAAVAALLNTRQRVFLSFATGFLIGLILFGWSIWPIQRRDAIPADLRADHSQIYLETVARLYELDGSIDLTHMLGGSSWNPEKLARDLNLAFRNTDAANQARLAHLGHALGLAVDGTVPPPAARSQSDALPLFAFVALGLVVALSLWRRSRRRVAHDALSNHAYLRVLKYLLVRALTIFITIVIGVFVTVVITNKSGQIDLNVKNKIESQVQRELLMLDKLGTEERAQAIEQARWQREEDAGLHLPFVPRHLRWTLNALTLDWGDVLFTNYLSIYGPQRHTTDAREIVLEHIINTVLLVGAGYLLIFLIGIPLALSLSRKYGHWLDRLFAFLAPLSSIPSWVHGVVLMLIFAVELRLLPVGGMFDSRAPGSLSGYIPVVLKHMLLPVSAIVVGMLFQMVYAWRTFFMIYANEDYVELATATGMSPKMIERKHILRPCLPYVITSFAVTLIGFWQMTTALEVTFEWPGIGQLYIHSLPHFWGESMFPGELIIALAVVVIFAYLLGVLVLALDVVYALVDPRVRIALPAMRGATLSKTPRKARRRSFSVWRKKKESSAWDHRPHPTPGPVRRGGIKTNLANRWQTVKRQAEALKRVARELRRYPTAVVGLSIITALLAGSIYAIVALPYSKIGRQWYTNSVSGQVQAPRLAWPEWTNWFRKHDLLSMVTLDSRDDTASKTTQPGTNGTSSVAITFTIDYPYGQVPDEMFINFTTRYQDKRPFVFMTWLTPDGREIQLKNLSLEASKRVEITDYIPRRLASSQYLADASAFADVENLAMHALFADPTRDGTALLPGTYNLRVDGLTFEDGVELDAELVLLGQVYGLAGTDFMRRDLLVPLLWGMPFALMLGLLGAVATTIASMVIAAAGVWFGGALDSLVQRITEANMILPILAISVLFYALYGVSIWTILGIIVLLNVFSSPTKAFRAAFLQVKESPYIEAAQAYGASDWRIITRYMIPRIIPVLIPQLVTLIPSYVFLEATMGMFNIKTDYPTWGRVIYEALRHGVSWGSRYWVLQPILLLLLTGFAFGMLGFALDRILNPRLREL